MARSGLFRSPKKSGGGMKGPGGGGGAMEGGGGTNISPSSRSGTDITDPLDRLSPPTVEEERDGSGSSDPESLASPSSWSLLGEYVDATNHRFYWNIVR
ncbi:hypothetical protein INR49_019212 [Caranx melampygus]|nr:hypothetical protein INR49_019212 [Caranx melampygus]